MDQLQSLGTLTVAAKAVAVADGLSDPTTNPQSELNPINLQNSLNITADQSSDVINLEVRLSSAQLAQDTAKQIYLAFVEENEDSTKEMAERAITSLQAQSADIDRQLKDVDQQVSDLRASTGMTDPTAQIAAEITGLTTLKQVRDQAAVDAAAARRSVVDLTQSLAGTSKTVRGTVSTTPNPIWQKLQGDLMQAESDRAALLQTYEPENEQVKAIDERIKAIKGQIGQVKPSIPGSSNEDLNQTYQVLLQQLDTAKAAADAADQKYTVAAQQVTDKEKYIQTLPPIQTKLAALDRQKTALEKIYFGYADELKTLEAAKEGRSSPTQMITPATALPEPVSPKPLINAVFGVIIGLLLGVASGQVLEAKRQPIRSLVQLNGLAHEPVYRIIPELREPFRGKLKPPHESYEALLIHYLRSGSKPYRLAVVGLSRDAGASTAALNVALAGSRHGSEVLYVQCDPKGALSRLGHRDPEPGQVFDAATNVRAMGVHTVLSVSGRNSGLDNSVTSHEGDLTVIDLEPASRSAEFAFVAPHVDEVLLLVRAGKARGVDFLQAQQALLDAGCKRITIVMTRTSDFAVSVDAVDDQPVSVPLAHQSPAAAPVTVEPVAEPVAEISRPEPVLAPEPKPEPEVEPYLAPVPVEEPTPVSAASISEEEGPLRKTRTTPTVMVEDFGSISRARPIGPIDEAASSPSVPAEKPRRRSVDTSDIDS